MDDGKLYTERLQTVLYHLRQIVIQVVPEKTCDRSRTEMYTEPM